MEALFAVTGKDFVLCASDDMQARSIVVMKRKHDKSINLNKNTILISSGDNGDCVNFSEFMQKNISLLEIQYGYRLSTEEIAHYTRRNLADALRTKASDSSTFLTTPNKDFMNPLKNAYKVNFLLGGVDPKTELPSLYWMDHLANCVKVPFGVQGYSSYFCNSIMDRYWKPNLTLEEAKGLLKKCIQEMETRFVGNFQTYTVKLVDKRGITSITL